MSLQSEQNDSFYETFFGQFKLPKTMTQREWLNLEQQRREAKLAAREGLVFVGDNVDLKVYDDEIRGIVAGNHSAGTPCSARFLESIRLNLMMTKRCMFLASFGPSTLITKEKRSFGTKDAPPMALDHWADLEKCVKDTKRELYRLQKHPELFEDTNKKEEFWQSIRTECEDYSEKQKQLHETRELLMKTALRGPRGDEQGGVVDPTDSSRSTWQNYLHNGAPGCGADLSGYDIGGSVQMVPYALARIVTSIVDENKIVADDIQRNRLKLGRRPLDFSNLSLGVIFNQNDSWPDHHRRTICKSTTILEPTFAGPGEATRAHGTNNLETLNLDFARLRGSPVPAQPNMWNCIWVIVIEHPGSSNLV